MWKCPYCKRIFQKEFQPHFCGKPSNVDEYIECFDEDKKEDLLKIRQIFLTSLSDANECISWGMPTYKKDKNIIHFAGHTNHIGIYPGVEALIHFKEKLKEYKTSKGAIQIPYKCQDLKLVQEIALWCYQNYKNKNKSQVK